MVTNGAYEAVVVQLSNLAAELAKAHERNERLVKALRFYADESEWRDFASDEHAGAFDQSCGSVLGDDMGKVARTALAAAEAA